MDPLVWVVAGIGVYWAAVLWLRRTGRLPQFIGTQGPILTVHTQRFRDLIERAATPRRAWRAWGNFGVGVALVVMFGMFAFLVITAQATLENPMTTSVNQPRNVLVIPGVNEFLPVSVAPEIVAGLLLGLVVHEGGHAVMCRVGDIDVESVGLALLGPIPIGAFVEPDEESRRRAPRGAQTRMFAAGVMNNFALTVVVFALLFGPVIGSVSVAAGAAVGGSLPGSPAAEEGIGRGDRIVAVNGEPVADNAAFQERLASIEEPTLRLEVATGDRTETVTVERELLVSGITRDTPFAGAVGQGDRIVAVNGTPVRTERGLERALANRTVATLETDDGDTVTGPIGTAVFVAEGGPAADSGVPTGPGVITSLNGTTLVTTADLSAALANTSPGQEIPVVVYRDGERRTHTVTLGERDGESYLGVFIPGAGASGTTVSGLTLTDLGTRLFPAEFYLRLIGGDTGAGFFGAIGTTLLLPFAGATGQLPYNFAGFTGGVGNFYTVNGALGLGGLVLAVANLLFWTGWINLNLAVFNCIPAFPLDGGHLLRNSTEAVVARLPIEGRRRLTTVVTTTIGLTMLAALLLTLFGPQLLA